MSRKFYSTRISLQADRFLKKIFDALNAAHTNAAHIFIQTVFAFYAVKNGIINDAKADHLLRNLPNNLVNDLRAQLVDNEVGFDWTALSPAVLGALIESIVNPDSPEGVIHISDAAIHKVIDPLFLDELRAEFDQCAGDRTRLTALHNKIASLTFFDPACCSGNFLVETFMSLRRLEKNIIDALDGNAPIKVVRDQFYGIDLSEFAIEIAQNAMWIADCRTRREIDPLNWAPKLKPCKHIVECNALTIDWKKFVPRRLSYIIGNPPSLGMIYQSRERKQEIADIFRDEHGLPYPKVGKIDYAGSWFFKAAQFMSGRTTRAAFVSTDSLCQSEQAQLVWQPLFERFAVHIDFAYRPLKWIDDCVRPQRLYCIIVGFSAAPSERPRRICDHGKWLEVSNINGYLLDAPNIFIGTSVVPLCQAPEMRQGNQPTDAGNLIIEARDYEDFIRREPAARKYIRRFMMGREFVNNLPRWCLWLAGATEEEIDAMPLVKRRVEAVRAFRAASTFIKTRRLAKKPHLFREQITPERFIALPKVLSDRRSYLTAGWLDSTVVAGDQMFMIAGAGLYEFGVLESSVHMAWVRALGGRFGAGYCYSKTIIYNNFVWCDPTEAQRAAIERTAQGILDARALYPDRTLAQLYDDRKMPTDLKAAHLENDRAVLTAYGFEGLTEVEIVSRLMTECTRRLQKRITE